MQSIQQEKSLQNRRTLLVGKALAAITS